MDNPIDKKEVIIFIEDFIKSVNGVYGDNCSHTDIIYHLIKKGILQTSKVRDYIICLNFYKEQTSKDKTRKDYCFEMSAKFDLSERQIHNIIGKNFKNFFIEKHIKEEIS